MLLSPRDGAVPHFRDTGATTPQHLAARHVGVFLVYRVGRGTPMSPSAGKVFVIEDEAAIRDLLRLHLGVAGFEVKETADGRTGLTIARAERFDVIILDVMLPGLDGVTVCRALRSDGESRDAAILMLTARDRESDKVLGLESGADDYVAKPFGVRELMARVHALMRRNRRGASAAAAPSRIESRQLTLDLEKRQAKVRDRDLDLTKQEFDLLYLLAARPGVVFSRAALLQQVWRDDAYVTERTVDTVISRLRRKIEADPQDPELILTAWGIGYKFADVD
jgi:DNA-binding response OmpR family regulator